MQSPSLVSIPISSDYFKSQKNKFEWEPTHPIAKIIFAYLRRTPNHPSKLRIIRSIIDTFFSKGIIVKNKQKSRLNLDQNNYIDWSIISTGSYEKKSIELASSLLSDGGIFLDIGANFGLWTCALGSIPQVQCFSIEPFAVNFVKLQQNLSLNPDVHCKAFNLALSKSENLVEMECINTKNLGLARVVLSDSNMSCPSHVVSTKSLKSLLDFAGITKITLLKIDVEGYELPILEGMDWNGSARPRNIIIEFSDYSSRAQGHGRKSVFDFFTKHGYEGLTIDGNTLDLEASVIEDNAYFRDIRVKHN